MGCAIAFSLSTAAQQETLLLRSPSISNNHIAFTYAGDIWVADRDGQHPHRVTVNPDSETDPMLSPDGKWIAFSGNYDGNIDVYVIPVEGGTPKRLTWHPSPDIVRGWQGNDKIIFSSNSQSFHVRYQRLFQVSTQGTFPQPLPMPEAHQGNISPDGTQTAYIKAPDPTDRAGSSNYRPFKHYRGGNTPAIWIFDNKSHNTTIIPSAGANNTRPVWIDNDVYFLSDRNGNTNVFRYNSTDKQVTPITTHKDYPVKTLFSDGRQLIYEQAGRIFTCQPGNAPAQIPVRIAADIPTQRPHWITGSLVNYNLSPSGTRAVVESRGEILSLPAGKGDVRNLTNTPGIHERSPSWSPDGKWIAYFSEESGEYALQIRDQKAEKPPTSYSLGTPDFYYKPIWSPDSKKILYYDKHMQLSYIDINSKKVTAVDKDLYETLDPLFSASWSQDARWITYHRKLENQLRGIFLFDIATGHSHQVTDGLSEAVDPTFSRDGKYLFFTASINYALNVSWLDMSSYEREVKRTIYAITLAVDTPSPLAPESDEEPVKEETTTDSAKTKKIAAANIDKAIRIDLEGIRNRIVALPLPAQNYGRLDGNVPGKLLYMADNTLYEYDIASRKSKTIIQHINNYTLSHDGKKLLYATNTKYGIINSSDKANVGDGALNTSEIRLLVDPVAEWKQMYNELWRLQRDYFYVANMHGADWKALRKKYEVFLPFVGHRDDLNYLFHEIMSELVIGHNYVGQGDIPAAVNVNTGMLGADYAVENGHYRFKKIYTAPAWDADTPSPLVQPGIQIPEGYYLLAVNGIPLNENVNLYSLFQNTAGKQTRILVNSKPDNNNAKEYTVIPVASEANLRLMDWVESNRRKVDQLSNGKLAYIYLPNTGNDGYNFFNRYYFAQLDKKGIVIDERFNGGGSAADYIINMLNRKLLNYWGTRDGKVTSTPGNAIFGPKILITNTYAGSGGDLLPYMFRESQLGTIVGTTTMGILVGIYNYPPLIDGGNLTVPRIGFYTPEGRWAIENEGVKPDIEVEMTPKEVIAGHDPQLEKAVELLLPRLDNKQSTPIPPAPVRAK